MPDAPVTRRVAQRVRSLRSQRGWSARRLAAECAQAGLPALTRGTIAKIESGVRKSVSAEEVAALARAFGVTPTSLMGAGLVESPADVGSEHPAEKLQILPVAVWDPIKLGIHPVAVGNPGVAKLPPYIPRRHDTDLRTLLRESSSRSSIALLVGNPGTGKTRSLYEVALQSVPERPLFFPLTGRELVDATVPGMIPPGTVIWLDEFQTYFDGPLGAEVAAAVRSLLRGNHLVTILATIQADRWAVFMTSTQDRASDLDIHVRNLLMTAEVFQVAESLESEEWEAAELLATSDPSLAAVTKAVRDGRLIPVLSAAPGLITRYEHPANPYGAAILTAAIDSYRLGHLTPLSIDLLREASPAYLTDVQRVAPSGWFQTGLQYATAPLAGGISALLAVRTRAGVGPPDGYFLQDFLAEYGKNARREVVVPTPVWDALLVHAADHEDRQRLAAAADQWLPAEYSRRFRSAASDVSWAEDTAARARQSSDAVIHAMQDYAVTGRLVPADLVEDTGLDPEFARADIKLLLAEVEPAPINSGEIEKASLQCVDDPELFFAESPEDVEQAKSLCLECPARIVCLAGALERREPWGVWGGELFLRGEIVPRKRPRGSQRTQRRATGTVGYEEAEDSRAVS